MKKPSTLFSRLFWSVAISEFIIFLFVGYFSYTHVKNVLVENSKEQSEALRNEISGLLDFQDFSIGRVERLLDSRLELASWELVELHFANSDSIESANLAQILIELHFDASNEFINILGRNGELLNTSSEESRDQNSVDPGDAFKPFIDDVFLKGEFISEDFKLFASDKKLHKWSYQPTHDGNYIIQIGVNSKEGSAISNAVRGIISKISENRESLLSIDIFINPKDPFSFASKADLKEEEKELIKSIFKWKTGKVIDRSQEDHLINTEYIYSQRTGSNLYESLVVRLIKDKTLENAVLRENLFREAGLFALGLIFLFVVLFLNTNLITKPIEMVSSASQSLGRGNLRKRVPVMGNRELRHLAESFNQMAIDLQFSDQKIRLQKEKIERAHKEIRDSINYAKRIQTAILPPERLVKKYLADSFILYKPKDIVAGDFYWLESKGETILFAAADCTGHGVPGAMISVLCHSALNRSVREYGLINPGKILDKTREIVLQEFDKSDDEVMDGMDIALCSLAGNQLLFAGAQRPLFIIRNKEIIEIKGSKQPIGVNWNIKPFECNSFELEKGDVIYLFSDGVTDQFGGDSGKKFLISRFKKLLLSVHSESMDKQKQLIDDGFEAWRGYEDQIDDVCVIGVRI